MRLHRGLGHCGVGSYISQPVCQPGVTSSGDDDEATGTGNVTRATGARQDPCSAGAFGTGASLASPLLSVSGIASNTAGALRPNVGVAGIGGAGAAEECVGSMLCVAPSGKCCVLRFNSRGAPQCPEC